MNKTKLDKLAKEVRGLWAYDMSNGRDVISVSVYGDKPQVLLHDKSMIKEMQPKFPQSDIKNFIICEMIHNGVQFMCVIYSTEPEYNYCLEKYNQLIEACENGKSA